MKNLTTQKGREKELLKIELAALNAFEKAGIKLQKNSAISVYSNRIEIGIKSDRVGYRYMFASEVDIYIDRESNSINFGTSGKFNPKDIASYSRTLNAAEILKNWDAACEIVNKYCGEYKKLEKEIFEANK